MSDCPELQRVTTDYVIAEDRLRLSGATADDQTVVMWVTQRLVNRLVAKMTQHLENSDAAEAFAADVDMVQGFAQQAAQASLEPQVAVRPESPAGSWLVDAIDVSAGPAGVALVMKSDKGDAARLILPTQALRQWLGILHEQYIRAEWSTAIWPTWMQEASRPAAKPDTVALH